MSMIDIISLRREFHKNPEIGWTEIRTSARVIEELRKLGIKNIYFGKDAVDTAMLTAPLDLSADTRKENMKRAVLQGADPDIVEETEGYPGVVAVIDTGKEGPVYAFRFDMDSLPYDEFAEKGYKPFDEEYSSKNRGCVHACGHDAHTAIGLGLAQRIVSDIDSYKGIIKLIFQPAEETNKGALSIVSKGHLDDVNEFYAIHLALSAENVPLPSHSICCGVKDFLSCRQMRVTFHGKAAHPCGAAQEGQNALLAACQATLAIHNIAPHEKGLCRANVGVIQGGDCTNTICPECSITLEYRGQYKEISEYMGERVMDCIKGAAAMYGTGYSIVDYGETPAGISDDEIMEKVKDCCADVPWFSKVYFEGNLGGSDDAAAMLTHVQERGGKGTYMGIGCDINAPLHNPAFDFDEECMEPTVELLSKLLKK